MIWCLQEYLTNFSDCHLSYKKRFSQCYLIYESDLELSSNVLPKLAGIVQSNKFCVAGNFYPRQEIIHIVGGLKQILTIFYRNDEIENCSLFITLNNLPEKWFSSLLPVASVLEG